MFRACLSIADNNRLHGRLTRFDMGWWKINSPERGGIDRTFQSGSGLLNAIPGKHTTENFYNGDGPADAMGSAVITAFGIMGITLPKPRSVDKVTAINRHELLELFLERRVPVRFRDKESSLLAVILEVWRDIDLEYQEDWGRLPCEEERLAVCSFVFAPLFA